MNRLPLLRRLLLPLLVVVLAVLAPAAAQAVCSPHAGKVVFNEVRRPTSGAGFIELKVLDPSVLTATSNFQNWKIALSAGNSGTRQTTDVSSGFTDIAINSCGQQSLWIRFPESVLSYLATSYAADYNFVLYDTSSGGQIIDILRLAITPTSYYGSGTTYTTCPAIESQLPATGTANTQFDALVTTSGASQKDWYRVPDGTGPWTGSATANSYDTICASNDGTGTYGIAKSPSVTTVAANTNFSYTLYSNNGATAVSTPASVVITDDLTAAGLTFVSCTASPGTTSGVSSGPVGTCTHSAGTVTWTVGAMAANKSYKVTLTVKAATAGTYTNTIVSNVASPAITATSAAVTVTGPAGPNHVELVHDGAGLTCTPKAVTVLGCTTVASCSGVPANQFTSGSFSISLAAIAGAQWCTDDTCSTTLGSPATVTNGTVIYLKDTNVRTDRMAGTSSSASTATIQCVNTTTAAFNSTTACDVTFGASGFVVTLPNHVSCANSTLTVEAVQANPGTGRCVPMFRSQNRAETISFSYVNPNTGTLVPSVAGTPISTGGTSVNLAFNNNGIATPSFVYKDVGNLAVTVTDPTLPMTGSATATVAPASFAFSGVSAGPIGAGNGFSATVTALNSCATPTATPNFGKEAVPESVTFSLGSRVAPAGANDCVNGPCDGTVAGSVTPPWSGGSATASNLSYSEVGQMTVKATLASGSYLGSGFTATGTSATAGDFVPAYFNTGVTYGCPAGSFTYSAQPFTVDVTAKNAAGGTTVNYSNLAGCTVCSKSVILQDPTATANFNGTNAIAATAFAKGVGARNNVTYTFPVAPTAPSTIALRAIDNSVTPNVTSAGHTEGTTAVRFGRLRLSNAFGSERAALVMPVQAEYWSGQSWLLNNDDSCTTVPATAIALAGPLAASTSASAVALLAGGKGTLTLAVPSPTGTGNIDVAINLGTTATDQSCLATHPTTTGANLVWLRSRNGNCAPTYDRDPSARASFGIYAPETKKTIHVREQF